MAAEVKIGLNSAELTAGLKRVEVALLSFQSKAKAATAGVSSKEAIRNVKDLGQPFSAGALSKIGTAGVGLFAVASAAKLAAGYIRELSTAEYLSTEQRGQMSFIVGFFDDIKTGMAEQNAGIITSIADMFTGGAVSQAGKDAADLAKKEKTLNLGVDRDAAVEAVRQQQLTDEQKLGEMKEKIAKAEAQMAKQTGDRKLETETRIAKMQLEANKLSETVAKEKASAAEKEASAIAKRESGAFDLTKDIQIAQATAKGDTKEAEKLRREKNIAGDARRIAEDLGLDPAAALQAAEALNPDTSKSGRIRGYSGSQRAKNRFLDQRSFKQFFHPDSFFDKKDLTPRASKEFNEFFGGKGKGKDGDGSNMSILEAQLAALEKLTSY